MFFFKLDLLLQNPPRFPLLAEEVRVPLVETHCTRQSDDPLRLFRLICRYVVSCSLFDLRAE